MNQISKITNKDLIIILLKKNFKYIGKKFIKRKILKILEISYVICLYFVARILKMNLCLVK